MKDNTLIAYLAERAMELAQQAETGDPAVARGRLEESAEMVALGAALLRQQTERTVVEMKEAA